jgi:hypothetical protein
LESVYCGPDVEAAEAALLDYVELIKEGRRGHDHIFGLAMTHGRLFLLYKATRESERAHHHYSVSVAHLRSWREQNGLPETPLEPEDLERTVQAFDEGLSVEWRKRLLPAVRGN